VTNNELVTDSYRAAGIVADGESPTAVQMQIGLRKFNQMMAIEAENDLTFPSWFEQTSLAATVALPDYALLWAGSALSIVLAGEFRVPVSGVTADIAIASRAAILRKRLNQALQPVELNIPGAEAGGGCSELIYQ
jgi:hypothetical protein